jgi:hypothetical protein
VDALRGVSLDIEEGRMTAVMGLSGVIAALGPPLTLRNAWAF